jgi:hypothetical protein
VCDRFAEASDRAQPAARVIDTAGGHLDYRSDATVLLNAQTRSTIVSRQMRAHTSALHYHFNHLRELHTDDQVIRM